MGFGSDTGTPRLVTLTLKGDHYLKGEIRMDLPGLQTWIVFYLISFVVLLWAAFLSSQGVMLWVSLLLVIIIIGLNFVTVLNQIKVHAARKAFQRELTKDFVRGEEAERDDRETH